MDHQKPTQDELDKGIEEAIKEAEKVESNDNEEKLQETPEEKVEEKLQEDQPESKVEEKVETPVEDKESLDYKERWRQSSREALIIDAKNKKLNEAIDKATELPEPNEDDLRREFGEWDTMSDTEKRLAKDLVVNRRFREQLVEARQEAKNIDEWNKQVDVFIDDPTTFTKYTELDGKQDEFKVFATKPTRRGVDFEDLVAAFLFDVTKNAKPKQKGAMFETPGGGTQQNPKPKSDKISVDEAANLRNTNYNKYNELLLAGKIEDL